MEIDEVTLDSDDSIQETSNEQDEQGFSMIIIIISCVIIALLLVCVIAIIIWIKCRRQNLDKNKIEKPMDLNQIASNSIATFNNNKIPSDTIEVAMVTVENMNNLHNVDTVHESDNVTQIVNDNNNQQQDGSEDILYKEPSSNDIEILTPRMSIESKGSDALAHEGQSIPESRSHVLSHSEGQMQLYGNTVDLHRDYALPQSLQTPKQSTIE